MAKNSSIPNRTTTCLSINAQLLKICKERRINISLVLDAALEREINPASKDAYIAAVSTKLHNLENWLQKNNLEKAYYNNVDGGENVLDEKKPAQENRFDKGSIGDI